MHAALVTARGGLGFNGGKKLLGGLAFGQRLLLGRLADLHLVTDDFFLVRAVAFFGPLRLGVVGVFDCASRGLFSGPRRGRLGR